MCQPDQTGRSREEAEAFERDYVPGVFGPWACVVADAATIETGNRVLDVGCGTGALTQEIARRTEDPYNIIGVDLDEAMLEVARRIEPVITWCRADAIDLPFSDGSVDAIFSQFALMFFSDRVRALQELWRVLAPRGGLTIAVWGSIDRAPGHQALVRIAERHAGSEAAGRIRTRFALGDRDEVASLFEEAGIPAEVTTHSGTGRYRGVNGFARGDVDSWIRNGELSQTKRGTVLRELEEETAGFIDVHHSIVLPLETHLATARKELI